jgi:hypothetical protein
MFLHATCPSSRPVALFDPLCPERSVESIRFAIRSQPAEVLVNRQCMPERRTTFAWLAKLTQSFADIRVHICEIRPNGGIGGEVGGQLFAERGRLGEILQSRGGLTGLQQSMPHLPLGK